MTNTDDKKPAETKPPRTLDAPTRAMRRVAAADGTKPRFASSGLEDNTVYNGTRVRRWEVYQVPVVRKSLANCGVQSAADLDEAVADEPKRNVIAAQLGTCLVCREKPRVVSQLFRKGPPGVQRMLRELTPAELAAAMKAAVELSQLF